METLTRTPESPQVALDFVAARRALRAQIARLEQRLAAVPPEHVRPGRADRSPAMPEHDGSRQPGQSPTILSLGELERVRDRLLRTLRAAQDAAAQAAAGHAAARARVEAMLADPAAHRWERVRRTDLGETGCGDYRVRPRLGLLGMLAGWWAVKLSSGCPLAMADRRNRRPENPVLETAVTLLVIAVLVATVLVFLFVYHDFPLRTS